MKLTRTLLFIAALAFTTAGPASAADQGNSKGSDLSDLLAAIPADDPVADPVTDNSVTIACKYNQHLLVKFVPDSGTNGMWFKYEAPLSVAASCLDGVGTTLYALDIPGTPQFDSYESLKAFIGYVSDNGETIATGKPNG